MNLKNNSSINDSVLVTWIEQQWADGKRQYKKSDTPEDREAILLSLSKILREYINAVRSKQSGVQQQYKLKAHGMIQFCQTELLKLGWTARNNLILKAIQYGVKHTGNLAIEGKSIHRPVTAADRKRLERLQREAEKRFADSLAHLNAQDSSDSADDSGADI